MPSLLLIEDDASYATALLRRLQKFGWQGQWHESVEAALATVAEVDAILLDQNLNGQSGLPAIKPLKARFPHAQLIVVTGYASIATSVSAIKQGADNYLMKPVEVHTLIRLLKGDDAEISVTAPDQSISVNELEWELIHTTLQAHSNNISATARALNMHRRTLQRKLQKKRP